MFYIGLMSGTSLDGVDAVLAKFQAKQPEFCTAVSLPLSKNLREVLLNLNQSGHNELIRAAQAAKELVLCYSAAVKTLLEKSNLKAKDIVAIGAHGQTVRHQPEQAITIQLNAPALLAEKTNIDVIADFRTRDMAAGGQGAPLVPPFHALLFSTTHPRAVLNIGGMANITVLNKKNTTSFFGFDTGPGNVLMDLWCQQEQQLPFDRHGHWAATGRVNQALLKMLLDEPWLKLEPPKSTGRDLFNKRWLNEKLHRYTGVLQPEDIQATLLAYTAETVANAVFNWCPYVKELIVCGGGAYNKQLLKAIKEKIKQPVISSSAFGIAPEYLEAFAFAWLAYAYDNKICAGHPAVTGANKPTVLGARYYA